MGPCDLTPEARGRPRRSDRAPISSSCALRFHWKCNSGEGSRCALFLRQHATKRSTSAAPARQGRDACRRGFITRDKSAAAIASQSTSASSRYSGHHSPRLTSEVMGGAGARRLHTATAAGGSRPRYSRGPPLARDRQHTRTFLPLGRQPSCSPIVLGVGGHGAPAAWTARPPSRRTPVRR